MFSDSTQAAKAEGHNIVTPGMSAKASQMVEKLAEYIFTIEGDSRTAEFSLHKKSYIAKVNSKITLYVHFSYFLLFSLID